MPIVALVATLESKSDETQFLADRLLRHGVDVEVVDVSLRAGSVLGGDEKRAAIETITKHAQTELSEKLPKLSAIVAIGGGTGGEIALNIMRAAPIVFPKVLVTTLPFDPRPALADNSIIIVPTLADICGLNHVLRTTLERVAAMTSGLCHAEHEAEPERSIAISSLGATEDAVTRLLSSLRKMGKEATVFHSNGYGGAALTRFARSDAFRALVDLTPHELTRIHIAGAHVDMPDRFSVAPSMPRIVLPGALNFIGLGALATISEEHLQRPHYAHSGFFTHVQITPDEMTHVAKLMAASLNQLDGPSAVIVPMGGFSHQDRPGGVIEAPHLRHVFLDTIRAEAGAKVTVTEIDAHIGEQSVTNEILTKLTRLLAETRTST